MKNSKKGDCMVTLDIEKCLIYGIFPLIYIIGIISSIAFEQRGSSAIALLLGRLIPVVIYIGSIIWLYHTNIL